MFDLMERHFLVADLQMQFLPDVVAEKLCRVLADTGRRVNSQNPLDRQRVVSVNPERQFCLACGWYRRVSTTQHLKVVLQYRSIGSAGMPSFIINHAIGIDVLLQQTVKWLMVNAVN